VQVLLELVYLLLKLNALVEVLLTLRSFERKYPSVTSHLLKVS